MDAGRSQIWSRSPTSTPLENDFFFPIKSDFELTLNVSTLIVAVWIAFSDDIFLYIFRTNTSKIGKKDVCQVVNQTIAYLENLKISSKHIIKIS